MQTQSRPAARRRASPFDDVRSAVIVAGAYAMLALVWIALGASLPGGRWLAVHLFTLGVLTNLVVALTQHFTQTLLHAPGRARGARLVAVNAGTVLVVAGLPAGLRGLVAAGATILVASVLWLAADLRRIRGAALTARFAFIVRAYEWACGAFVQGALLGALMGTGVLSGTWYAAARIAHLHVNVLGWGGLTLLASIVFFGPTVLRTRMQPGADAAAALWLRRAAAGLAVATVALLLTGAGGALVMPARLVAAAGLAVYAVGVAVVCVPVVRAGRRARTSGGGRMLQSAGCWFVAAAAADVVVVATGRFDLLDTLGAAMLVGVLGQTILGSVGHIAPLAWKRGSDRSPSAPAPRATHGWLRPLVFNAGLASVVAAGAAGAAGGQVGAVAARAGWLLIVAAAGFHLAVVGITAARGAIGSPRG